MTPTRATIAAIVSSILAGAAIDQGHRRGLLSSSSASDTCCAALLNATGPDTIPPPTDSTRSIIVNYVVNQGELEGWPAASCDNAERLVDLAVRETFPAGFRNGYAVALDELLDRSGCEVVNP